MFPKSVAATHHSTRHRRRPTAPRRRFKPVPITVPRPPIITRHNIRALPSSPKAIITRRAAGTSTGRDRRLSTSDKLGVFPHYLGVMSACTAGTGSGSGRRVILQLVLDPGRQHPFTSRRRSIADVQVLSRLIPVARTGMVKRAIGREFGRPFCCLRGEEEGQFKSGDGAT
jgi:hypothetical protein